MGESKTNPVAVAAATRPAMPPGKFPAQLGLGGRLVPKLHVLVLPEDRIRVVDGKTEVYGRAVRAREDGTVETAETDTWHPAPDGAVAWPAGKTLPLELADYVVEVVGLRPTGLADAKGQMRAEVQHLVEIARMDALMVARQQGEA